MSPYECAPAQTFTRRTARRVHVFFVEPSVRVTLTSSPFIRSFVRHLRSSKVLCRLYRPPKTVRAVFYYSRGPDLPIHTPSVPRGDLLGVFPLGFPVRVCMPVQGLFEHIDPRADESRRHLRTRDRRRRSARETRRRSRKTSRHAQTGTPHHVVRQNRTCRPARRLLGGGSRAVRNPSGDPPAAR